MTLFRDDAVVFGGAAVGGIRISHMSNLERPVTMSLTASKQSRKPYVVQPLASPAKAAAPAKKTATAEEKLAKAQATLGTILLDIAAQVTPEDVDAAVVRHADMVARIAPIIPDAANQVATAANDAKKD
jgi:hypothetical protein